MAASIRDFDWSATPLGSVEEWTYALRTVAALLLGSAFPRIVLWGPELTAESEPGKGSTFTVTMPRAHVDDTGEPQ